MSRVVEIPPRPAPNRILWTSHVTWTLGREGIRADWHHLTADEKTDVLAESEGGPNAYPLSESREMRELY